MRTTGPKLPSWHYWLYWTGVTCAFAAALIVFGVIRCPGRRAQNYNEAVIRARLLRSNPAPPVNLAPRRLYPYSVIPGGVEDAQELRNAIANDPSVAALYVGFDLSRVHVVRLAHDQEVYVSYRLGGRIYWTKKRLLLRAGETVITDGSHEARARCGNRLSETPMQPVRTDEPDAAANGPSAPVLVALNQAGNQALPSVLPVDPLSVDPAGTGLSMFPSSPSTPAVNAIPPPIFPIVGGGPPSFPNVIPPPTPPPVSTPEPSGLSLLAFGLLALAVGWITKLGNRRKA